MDKLTSLDYAELIRFAAYKYHNVLLGKTQLNKILFYVYGVYLTKETSALFDDDTPKAWPYGPVFPIVNKKIDLEKVPNGFSPEKSTMFKGNVVALKIVREAVDRLANKTAYQLTEWSHKDDSPWYKTLFGEGIENPKWNTTIKDDDIKTYFKIKSNLDV